MPMSIVFKFSWVPSASYPTPPVAFLWCQKVSCKTRSSCLSWTGPKRRTCYVSKCSCRTTMTCFPYIGSWTLIPWTVGLSDCFQIWNRRHTEAAEGVANTQWTDCSAKSECPGTRPSASPYVALHIAIAYTTLKVCSGGTARRHCPWQTPFCST